MSTWISETGISSRDVVHFCTLIVRTAQKTTVRKSGQSPALKGGQVVDRLIGLEPLSSALVLWRSHTLAPHDLGVNRRHRSRKAPLAGQTGR